MGPAALVLHSVEITEIYSHEILEKISSNQHLSLATIELISRKKIQVRVNY